jgi:carbamoyltransferase
MNISGLGGAARHNPYICTSMNHRDKPMVCSSTDTFNMRYSSDLQFLIMENVLVIKEEAATF